MDHGHKTPRDCPNGYNCKQPGWVFECEAGTFAPTNNLDCKECPIGFSCQKGLPTLCKSGKLANSTGQEMLRNLTILILDEFYLRWSEKRSIEIMKVVSIPSILTI